MAQNRRSPCQLATSRHDSRRASVPAIFASIGRLLALCQSQKGRTILLISDSTFYSLRFASAHLLLVLVICRCDPTSLGINPPHHFVPRTFLLSLSRSSFLLLAHSLFLTALLLTASFFPRTSSSSLLLPFRNVVQSLPLNTTHVPAGPD